MPDAEEIPFTRADEFVVDDDYAARATLAAMRWPRPLGWVTYLYGPLVAVVGLIQFLAGGNGTILLVIGVVLGIAFPVIAYGRSIALLRRQVPVGSIIRAAFDSAEFTVERAGSRLTQSYDQVRGARRLGEIVVFRNINGLTYVLPGAIVSDADLLHLGGSV